jgi:ribosomal protein S18 acetylase RimI-like enzyme
LTLKLGTRHDLGPDRALGPVELRRLDWDTNFFGRKMGVLGLIKPEISVRAVERVARDLRLALHEAAADGYEHLILRLPANYANAIRAAEQAGLRLVDFAVDLQVRLPGRSAASLVGPHVRPASPQDVVALQQIAGGAFGLSRFAADPFFSGDEVAAFYREWTTNLCNGLAAAVLVAEASDEVAGFVSCAIESNGTGRIPLVATSETHRRRGIGRALIDASMCWFVGAGMREVFVKTQAANYSALALYQSWGFRIARAEVTLSANLNGAEDRPR